MFGKLRLVSSAALNLKVLGTPTRRYYTFVFHDGTIAPVKANVKVDVCEGEAAPTTCQIYELDLGIQDLVDGGFEDYRFVI